MCFSSPLKSHAPCLLHPPLSSYRAEPESLPPSCPQESGPPSGSASRRRAMMGRKIRSVARHVNVSSEHSVLADVKGRMNRNLLTKRDRNVPEATRPEADDEAGCQSVVSCAKVFQEAVEIDQ
ncbi:hypothetical protein IRJ41_004993 [Triplophysa rosa]|uniref:Uncharacterized protein n=1 Tax=Triplophysa rosa TaxID=992332 RepID=A0A9W7WQA4_TRIRA|nr:hypothetical protein IRJ41_004993 [Triplophysa rosa]